MHKYIYPSTNAPTYAYIILHISSLGYTFTSIHTHLRSLYCVDSRTVSNSHSHDIYIHTYLCALKLAHSHTLLGTHSPVHLLCDAHSPLLHALCTHPCALPLTHTHPHSHMRALTCILTHSPIYSRTYPCNQASEYKYNFHPDARSTSSTALTLPHIHTHQHKYFHIRSCWLHHALTYLGTDYNRGGRPWGGRRHKRGLD
jgi:hypothetical protein